MGLHCVLALTLGTKREVVSSRASFTNCHFKLMSVRLNNGLKLYVVSQEPEHGIPVSLTIVVV